VAEDDMNGRRDVRDSKAVAAGACAAWAVVLALQGTTPASAQITSPEGAPPPGSVNPGKTITLRVYNYARIPRAILITAEGETTRIFRKTGVETAWIDCRVSTVEPRTPACEQPFTSSDLFLRLLPPHMARAVPSYADTFGITFAERNRLGTDAIILCGRVMELARTEYLYEQDILAAVMAHEIGHLLLGGEHSPTGIMRAKWNRGELRMAGQGLLQFTPEQSLLIRDEVARRADGDGPSK
jgi:hypothetical protein